MHQWGINLRLLGFVRSLFKLPPDLAKKGENDEVKPLKFCIETARSSLLVEMIARTSKSYIRSAPDVVHLMSHFFDSKTSLSALLRPIFS